MPVRVYKGVSRNTLEIGQYPLLILLIRKISTTPLLYAGHELKASELNGLIEGLRSIKNHPDKACIYGT